MRGKRVSEMPSASSRRWSSRAWWVLPGLGLVLTTAAGELPAPGSSQTRPVAAAAALTPASAAPPRWRNTSSYRGHGRFSAPLQNDATMVFEGGPVELRGEVDNAGSLELKGIAGRFRAPVRNEGLFKTTDADAHFEAGYSGGGVYVSDPSNNFFTDLVVGSTGYLVGGLGDNFYISGDFISASVMNEDWETTQSYLEFRTGSDSDHAFHITGDDLGALSAGYTDNFAWGSLNIRAGNTLELFDGNATPGGALYVSELTGLVISGFDVTNVTGSDDLNLYYDSDQPANAPLGGQVYRLGGRGYLIPTGPPVLLPGLGGWTLALLAILLAACARTLLASAGWEHTRESA